MRIGLDFSAVRTTGTIVYCEGFLPALANLLDPEDELFVFGPPGLEALAAQLNPEQVRFLSSSAFTSVPRRICWQQFALPRLIRELGIDVLFSSFDIGPWKRHCPMVLGIRNPNPITLADANSKHFHAPMLKRSLHQILVRGSCRSAALVIFPSRYAADTIGDLLDVARNKRRVVYHGLDAEFWLQSKSVSDGFPDHLMPRGKYILFASKFYIQKRATLLLDAFSSWRRVYDRTDYKLVFCGEDSGSKAAEAMRQKVAALRLQNEVRVLGVVERPALRALYRHASQFVLPTVLETFGFPYVEAMASGIPLVCADIEISRELCGEAAYFFRADDPEALVETMEHAATDPERSRKLALGLERARNFSWQREARETLACLRAAAGRAQSATALPLTPETCGEPR